MFNAHRGTTLFTPLELTISGKTCARALLLLQCAGELVTAHTVCERVEQGTTLPCSMG